MNEESVQVARNTEILRSLVDQNQTQNCHSDEGKVSDNFIASSLLKAGSYRKNIHYNPVSNIPNQ